MRGIDSGARFVAGVLIRVVGMSGAAAAGGYGYAEATGGGPRFWTLAALFATGSTIVFFTAGQPSFFGASAAWNVHPQPFNWFLSGIGVVGVATAAVAWF